jgi:RecB family endonuclease NucS
MSVYLRGKVWYVDVWINKVRIQKPAGHTKEEAEAFQANLRNKRKQQKIEVNKDKIVRKLLLSMSTPEKQKCDTIANLLKTKHEQVKKQLNRRLTTPPERIPEKYLEDYLEKNLEVLEQGLKFKSRQAILELGRLDIVAENVANEMVLIELKTDPSEYIGMDNCAGRFHVILISTGKHQKCI